MWITPSQCKTVIPIPNIIILMQKVLLLLILASVRLPKLILFNLHLPKRIKINRKGRVRTRRKIIVIHNLIKPKCKPLMKKIRRKPRYPCLHLWKMISTRKIVRRRAQVTKFLQGTEDTSYTRTVLSQPFPFSAAEPSWSFMTNLHLLPHLMSSCVLVILQEERKFQSQLEPKITLRRKRKLMIYHHPLVQPPPPTSPPNRSSSSRNDHGPRYSSSSLLRRQLFESLHLTLTPVLPKTTVL
jgi:hypothetical protein